MKAITLYKRYISALIVTTAIFLGCSEDVGDKSQSPQPDNRTITLRASMPADNPSTRITLEEMDGSLDLSTKWKAGDKVKLFFMQGSVKAESGETTVFNISANGKQAAFDISLPQEIDISVPFDLYAFCGIPGQGARLIDENILADISPIKSVSLTDFSAPVWSKSKDITSLSADIELTLNHLGAYEVIHLKNDGSQNIEVSASYLIPEDTNSPLWHHSATAGTIPVFNPVTETVSSITGESGLQSSTAISIEPAKTKTLISWYVPNETNIPTLKLKMNDSSSSNSNAAKDFAMQKGNAYHVYGVWDGAGLNMTDDDYIIEAPNITIITETDAGQSLNLKIDAPEADRTSVWIDLNGNGKLDPGEADIDFNNRKDYTIHTKTVVIYGKVTLFEASSNKITQMDVSENTFLTRLVCTGNNLTELDLENNPELTYLGCSNNKITSLDVSKNIKLTILYCSSNKLTTLNIKNNINLEIMYCDFNPLRNIDLSGNINLKTLWCYNTELSTIDISNNINLEILQCQYNDITALDLTNNIALKGLSCRENKLTALNVTKNTNLTSLTIDYNQLSEIDISNLPLLKRLDCSNNNMIKLDVSNNTQLSDLSCYQNPLLTCIKVNQTQLANIPSNWYKDNTASYNLNCN